MSKAFDDDDKCIFIGGLRRDLTAAKLKNQLKYLFKRINLSVQKGKMLIINNQKSDYCFGFVDLEDVDTVEYVIHLLGNETARDNMHFDFSLIQDPNKRLKVDYKKPPKQIQQPTPQNNRSNNGVEDSTWAAKKFPFSNSNPENNQNSVQTSTTGLPKVVLSKPALPSIQNETSHVSTTTSVGGLVPNISGRFYQLKEKLGNETRTVEFKQGGFVSKDKKNVLQENIGKYVCAFLNTQGGTLYVGVDNDGAVVGVTCDQQEEDKHRLSIDQAIKMIRPRVMPDLYTVNFVPVLDQRNSLASNLKVLEVCVSETDRKSDLFLYRDDAYIRRDGSVQMLKGQDVLDWERRRLGTQQEGREQLLHRLCERTEEVQRLQEHIATLEKIKDHRSKKSKVCSIM